MRLAELGGRLAPLEDAIKEFRAGGGPFREPGGCDHVCWEDSAERGASSAPSSDAISVMREEMYEGGRGGSRPLFSAVCRFESSGIGGLGEVDMVLLETVYRLNRGGEQCHYVICRETIVYTD